MSFFKKIRFSTDYIIVLLCLALANIYYFAPSFKFYPAHDSMNWLTHYFYVFYNEYFINGQLSLWLPYNLFGIPSDYYLITIMSPAQYFGAFAGKLLGIKNALTVLTASMVLEQLAFVTGMYLLSLRFFKHRLSTLFVCIGSVFTIFWGANFGFNFRFYYLMPFVLLFIVKLFDTGQIKYLWIAGIVAVISLIGNAPYYLPIYLLVYSIFFIALFITRRRELKIDKKAVFSLSSFLFLLFFVAIAFIYVDFLKHIFDNISSCSPGRSISGKVSIDDFLKHGGLLKDGLYVKGSGINSLWQFIYACPRTYDFTIYIGLIPIVFIVYGLLHLQNNPLFKAISITGLVILLLSFGELSFVASSLYLLFPLMGFYRHISYLPIIVKVFLLVMAGFGIDHYLQNTKTAQKFRSPAFIGIALTALILITDIFIFKGKFGYARIHGDIISYRFHFIPLFTLIFMIFYLLRSPKNIKNKVVSGVVFLYFFEIASFSAALFLGMPVQERSPWAKAAFNVNRYAFQNERCDHEMMYRLRPYMPSAMNYARINETPMLFSAFYVDPSPSDVFKYSKMRVDIMSSSIDQLFQARFGKDIVGDITDKLLSQEALGIMANDKVFMRSLGCDTPKIRIVSGPKIVSDMNLAKRIVQNSSDMDINPIIYSTSPQIGNENVVVSNATPKKTSRKLKNKTSTSMSEDQRWYNIQFQQKIGPTTWPFWESNTGALGWLLIEQQQKRAKKLIEYMLGADYEPGIIDRMPADWVLQGSKNGKSWIELDRRVNEVDWRLGEGRCYKISNPTPFKFYRLYVERLNNNGTLMRVGSMKIRLDKDVKSDSFSMSASNKGFNAQVLPVEKAESHFQLSAEKIASVNLTANTVNIVADVSSSDSWLVYLDNYHPGWKAAVNGSPTEVARANIAFKAVKLNPGRNEIKFEFTGNHRTRLYVNILFILGIISSLYIIIIAIALSCASPVQGFATRPALLLGVLAFLTCLSLFVLDFGLHNDYSFLMAPKPARLTFTNILFGFTDENPHLILVGRPINAFLMGLLAVTLNSINDFVLMRFVSFLITLIAGYLTYIYLKSRMSLNSFWAAAIAFGIFALPSSQVYIIWVTNLIPGSLTVLVACVSYFIFDRSFDKYNKFYHRPLLLIVAFMFLFGAFLIYPPNALFFLVFTTAKIFFSKLNEWPKTRRRVTFDIIFCGLTTFFYLSFVKFILAPLFIKFYPKTQELMIDPQRYSLIFSRDLFHKAVQFYDMSLMSFGAWFHAQFDEKIAYPIFFLLLGGALIILFKYVLLPWHQTKNSERFSRLRLLKWIFQIIFFALFIILFSTSPVLAAKGSFISYRLIFPYCAMVVLLIFWVLSKSIETIFKNRQNLTRAVTVTASAMIILSAFLASSNLYSSALSAKRELVFIRQKIVDEMPWNTTRVLIIKPPWGSSFVEPIIKHEFNYMASNYNDTPLANVIVRKELGISRTIHIHPLGKRLLMNDLYKEPYKEFYMDKSFETIEADDSTFLINMNEIANSRVKGRYAPYIKKYASSAIGPNASAGVVSTKEGYKGFNIVKFGRKYYAILQSEGAFQIKKAKAGGYSKLFQGRKFKDVKKQIDTNIQPSDYVPLVPLLVEEGYRGFNIVQFGNQYYAILQGEGAFEIEKVKAGSYSKSFQSDKVEDVKKQIDLLPKESFSDKLTKWRQKIARHLY